MIIFEQFVNCKKHHQFYFRHPQSCPLFVLNK